MRSLKISIFFITSVLMSASCFAEQPEDLIIIIPNHFSGFGAIFQADLAKDEVGRLESVSPNTLIGFLDNTGGIGTNLLSKRLSSYRITAFFMSGSRIPIHITNKESSDGVRLWLLPKPKSGDIYFYVGSLEEVSKFNTLTNEVYSSRFSIKDYFLTAKRLRK